MRVVHNDQSYIVSWSHIRNRDEIMNLCCSEKYSAVTVCNIIPVANEEASEQGYAFCVEGDIFNKETGRKISLTRALKGLPKDFRTFVWKTYFSR